MISGYLDSIPEAPGIEAAYRAAHSALEKILPADYQRSYVPAADLDFEGVMSQFHWITDEAEMAVAGILGPIIGWSGPRVPIKEWDYICCGVDFDRDGARDFGVTLNRPATRGPWEFSNWHDCSLDHASRAYRREARWDFAPEDDGIWLLTIAPISGAGTDSEFSYTGRLVSFAVLYDRDEDDAYESVGHIWTARAWRRRGLARNLLREAQERFGASKVEGPFTDDGAAFVRACPLGEGPAEETPE